MIVQSYIIEQVLEPQNQSRRLARVKHWANDLSFLYIRFLIKVGMIIYALSVVKWNDSKTSTDTIRCLRYGNC